jgi:CP family cyanate transporter-like MFS transporter
MNGWIASYNQALHEAVATPLALGILNGVQLPVSLIATFFANRLAGRRTAFIVIGVICFVSVVGWVLLGGTSLLEALWAGLLGGSASLILTLGLALPPLLARREEVARLTGVTLTISYSIAFLGPLLGGYLWDLSHLPALAFLPVAIASVALIVLGAALPERSAFFAQERDAIA